MRETGRRKTTSTRNRKGRVPPPLDIKERKQTKRIKTTIKNVKRRGGRFALNT